MVLTPRFLARVRFESPRWLLIRSRDAEARRVLERTTRENVEAEMAEIRASLAGAGDTGERLFRKKYFIPILLAFLCAPATTSRKMQSTLHRKRLLP